MRRAGVVLPYVGDHQTRLPLSSQFHHTGIAFFKGLNIEGAFAAMRREPLCTYLHTNRQMHANLRNRMGGGGAKRKRVFHVELTLGGKFEVSNRAFVKNG